MGKSTQPLLKRCKALGINPVVMGYTKESKRNQKEVRRAKKSEYGLQLTEKQKLRFIYGVLEKQFRKYYVMATKKTGVTGEVLLQILESRKKVDIPSYLVKVGDVISVKEESRASAGIKTIVLANSDNKVVPGWLEVDAEKFTGKVVSLAARSDIDYAVKENLIVEYYSK